MRSRTAEHSQTLLNALLQKLQQFENPTVWIAYDSQTQERKLFSSEAELKTWLNR